MSDATEARAPPAELSRGAASTRRGAPPHRIRDPSPVQGRRQTPVAMPERRRGSQMLAPAVGFDLTGGWQRLSRRTRPFGTDPSMLAGKS